MAIGGMLALRDAPGSDPNAPLAHGSGFDRVRAFRPQYLHAHSSLLLTGSPLAAM